MRGRARPAAARRRRASRPSAARSPRGRRARAPRRRVPPAAPPARAAMRRPNETLPQTSRCGKGTPVLEHQPDAAPVGRDARRCPGRRADPRPASGRCRPAIDAQQRALAAAARPEHGNALSRRATLEVDAGERVEAARTRRRGPRPRAITAHPRLTATRSASEDGSRRQDHQHDASAAACAGVDRARPAEEAEDRDGQRGRVAARDEDRGAELAERDREGEAGGDAECPQHERQVDLAPDARAAALRATAAASRSRGSIDRSAGATIRTTKGDATSACATGTSQGDERKSSGGSSKAITKPNPSITADAPSGSMTRTSSHAAARPRDRERGQPADHERDHGRRGGEQQRVRRSHARHDEQRGRLVAERPVEAEAVARRCRERALDEGGDRHGQPEAGRPRARRRPPRAGHLRGRRSASRSAASGPRCRPGARRGRRQRAATATKPSWTSESTAAARRSKSRAAWL